MFDPKEMLGKTEVAAVLAKLTANKLREAGLSGLDVADVLGIAVTSILGVLISDPEERGQFIDALQAAHQQFKTVVALRNDADLKRDPMAALARVVSEHLPRGADREERNRSMNLLRNVQALKDMLSDLNPELLKKIEEASGHKDCAGCRDAVCKDKRTPEWYLQRVGREPTRDEMRIVNCGCAGEPKHATCGVCKTCDMPFMLCTCVS